MFMYYILAFSPFIIYMLINPHENKKNKNIYFLLCGIIILFILGFRSRYMGSADVRGYYDNMKQAISLSSWTRYYSTKRSEEGFHFFVWMLSRIFKQPQWLLIITSLLYIISIFHFTGKYSKSYPITIFMYVTVELMLFQLQGMRQAIAISIGIFAFDFAINKKIIKFGLLVLLATQFHRTAIVLFLLYPLCNIKLSGWRVVLMILLSAAIIYSSEYIITVANNMFSNEFYDRQYNSAVSSGGYIVLIIHVSVLILALFEKNEIIKSKELTALFYVSAVGTVCYIMRYLGTREAERISFYFAYAQLALLPNTIKLLIPKDKKVLALIYMLMIVLFLVLYYSKLLNNNFLPYRFCF